MPLPPEDELRLLPHLEPWRESFVQNVREFFGPRRAPPVDDPNAPFWHDVFVPSPLPWKGFGQSLGAHATAMALVAALSWSWAMQNRVRPHAIEHSAVTYTPVSAYLPPLDTGSRHARPQKGDPVRAKQQIISVPPDADNRSQTIVTPPELRIQHEVPLPNIIAVSPTLAAIPLEATARPLPKITMPAVAPITPAPEANTLEHTRRMEAPQASVIAPPPEITALHSRRGDINIGPAQVIAPAPQLTIDEQHTLAGRSVAGMVPGNPQVAPPPPTISGAGTGTAGARIVALGIHPVEPTGPLEAPNGNRRGEFEAGPSGKPEASGTPTVTGTDSGSGHGSGQPGPNSPFHLPTGLHVGASAGLSGTVAGTAPQNSTDGRRTTAMNVPPKVTAAGHEASPIPDERVTETDRKVFGGRPVYSMTMNLPNLGSASGSWIFRFAELKGAGAAQPGGLTTPVATQKVDPAYPLELMKQNVQGTVTLYAVIGADGSVGKIRVLNSAEDDRLDEFARAALARWHFHPAEKSGAPVAVEAVVTIPFKPRRTQF